VHEALERVDLGQALEQRLALLAGLRLSERAGLDRLAPRAAAVLALGTCAAYGGIPAMKNNATGAMGVPDYLGWNWKSKAGLPVVFWFMAISFVLAALAIVPIREPARTARDPKIVVGPD